MKNYKIEVECPECRQKHMAKANHSQATRKRPPQFLGYSVYCPELDVEIEIDSFSIRWALSHGARVESQPSSRRPA